jgi:hypothetical protein
MNEPQSKTADQPDRRRGDEAKSAQPQGPQAAYAAPAMFAGPLAALLRHVHDHPESTALRPVVARQLRALQATHGNQHVQRLMERTLESEDGARRELETPAKTAPGQVEVGRPPSELRRDNRGGNGQRQDGVLTAQPGPAQFLHLQQAAAPAPGKAAPKGEDPKIAKINNLVQEELDHLSPSYKVLLQALISANKLRGLPQLVADLRGRRHEEYGTYFGALLTVMKDKGGEGIYGIALKMLAKAGVQVTEAPAGGWSISAAIYRRMIASTRVTRNLHLAMARRLVSKLPERLQPIANKLVDGAFVVYDTVISLGFAVVGFVIGLVKGLIGIVTGLLHLIKAVGLGLYGLVTGAWIPWVVAQYKDPKRFFERYVEGKAIDEFLKRFWSGIKQQTAAWLEKFKKAPSERQSAMIGEFTGEIVAFIASFWTPGGSAAGRAGEAGRAAEVGKTAAQAEKAAAEGEKAVEAAEAAGKAGKPVGAPAPARTGPPATAPAVGAAAAPARAVPLVEQTSERVITRCLERLFKQKPGSWEGHVHLHTDERTFEAAYLLANGKGKVPSAFVDTVTMEIHIGPHAEKFLDAVHEAVHKIVRSLNPKAGEQLGYFLEEGITESVAQQMVVGRKLVEAYGENVAFARLLRQKLGANAVEKAFMRGDFEAFHSALVNKLGPARAKRFLNLLRRIKPGPKGSAVQSELLKRAVELLERM